MIRWVTDNGFALEPNERHVDSVKNHSKETKGVSKNDYYFTIQTLFVWKNAKEAFFITI